MASPPVFFSVVVLVIVDADIFVQSEESYHLLPWYYQHFVMVPMQGYRSDNLIDCSSMATTSLLKSFSFTFRCVASVSVC